MTGNADAAAVLGELVAYHGEPEAAARRWRAEGGAVVGYVGVDVPRELISAAGMLPTRFVPDPSTDLAWGDRILGAGVDELARRQLARLVAHGPGPYDHLVISRDRESSLRLFTALRHWGRVEPGADLPSLYFLDFWHLSYRTTAAYNRTRVRELAAVLESWSGGALDPASVAAAIAEANENRQLLARVRALRRARPPRLTGTEMLAVVGAGMLLPTGEHNRLLRRLLADPGALPTHGGVRVFVTGSDQDGPGVYRAIERAGAVVVGEDHDWGDRCYDGLVTEDAEPYSALVERYHTGSAAGRRYEAAQRAAYTVSEAVAAGADVVVCWLREHDDAVAWDVPEQRRRLSARGIPLAVFERQPYAVPDEPGLAARLAATFAAPGREERAG